VTFTIYSERYQMPSSTNFVIRWLALPHGHAAGITEPGPDL